MTSDEARSEFSELLRQATEPPGHLDGFDAKLEDGLNRVDSELRQPPRRQHVRLKITLAAALCVAVLVVPLLLSLSGSSSQPNSGELLRMRRTVEIWERADSISWPPAYYSSKRLPPGIHRKLLARRLSVAHQIGTTSFVDSASVQMDSAGVLEEWRKATGRVLVRTEREVMSVAFDHVQLDGDIVLLVKVWVGERSARWNDLLGSLIAYRRVDTTPVFRYTMREEDGQWRIAGRQEAVLSEDASQALYGPTTPHSQFTPREEQ